MGFFKRLFGGSQDTTPPFAKLGVDVHSHLIPGIDDGAGSLEESMAMVRKLHLLGYRKLITTPHIMSDAYRNTPEGIRAGLSKVREAVAAEGLEMEMEAAAEYYVDEVFARTLGTRELLTFGGDKRYLLFETSYVDPPMVLNDVIFELQTKGIIPVMAHPERYQYLWEGDAVEHVRELSGRGVKMQVNLSSFGGRYSKKAATIARDLAEEGLIDFIGTDLHRFQQVETYARTIGDSKELRQLVEGGTLLNHTL